MVRLLRSSAVLCDMWWLVDEERFLLKIKYRISFIAIESPLCEIVCIVNICGKGEGSGTVKFQFNGLRIYYTLRIATRRASLRPLLAAWPDSAWPTHDDDDYYAYSLLRGSIACLSFHTADYIIGTTSLIHIAAIRGPAGRH